MTPDRFKDIWRNAIIPAYDETTIYGPHGRTGDPYATIEHCFSKKISKKELREALGIIARIKKHDGRFGHDTRSWLYEGMATKDMPVDPSHYDWYINYGCHAGDLDHIHTSHLEGLSYTLMKTYDSLPNTRSGRKIIR